LVALVWDPTAAVERVVTIDAATGTVTNLAALPPEHMWFGGCVFDPGSARIYQSVSPDVVLTIDATSGALLEETTASPAPLANFWLAGVNAAGEVLGHAWDPSASLEHVVTLDTPGGAVSSLGALPPAYTAFTGTAYDHAANLLYTQATDGITHTLLRIDGATGGFLGATPIALGPFQNLLGLVANSAGELVGLAWDGAASLEHVVKLDPMTGAVTSVDTLPPQFTLFNGTSTVDVAADRIYRIETVGQPMLLTFEASSGAYLGATPVALNQLMNPVCFQVLP
jgi:hypothetical protein